MPSRLLVPVALLLLGLLCVSAAPRPQHGDEDPVAIEKQLRARFKKAIRSKDPARRIEAVVTYSAATRQLAEDGGAEKLVARTLAGVLDDKDMGVCSAAMVALSWGRHVETVIDACDETLEYVRNIMEKTSTRPDEESRALYRGALDVYRVTCATLGNYRDDRSVDALETELRALRPGTQLEAVAQNLLRPVVAAMLTLGSDDAVELVIKQTTVYSASTLGGSAPRERLLETMARSLHESLSNFAIRIERAPPAFTQNYQQDWHAWYKQHRKLFADHLGKLKEPPGPVDEDALKAVGKRGGNKPRRP